MAINVEIPYSPRTLQDELHGAWSEHRYSVAITHRRFGKTVSVINHLIRDALKTQKDNARFHLLSPTFRQAKSVSWDYLKNFSAGIPGVKFNESELRADYPNGSRIALLSAENGGQGIRGIYSDGFFVDEAGMISETIFPEIIRPALAPRNGLEGEQTYCHFVGTPMGHNALFNYYTTAKETEGWHCAVYKASETGILPEEELRASRETMPEGIYEAEFECSFEANVQGAVYARELSKMEENGQIGRVPFDPAFKVQTFWDLGINDSTVILFAQLSAGNRAVNIIDHVNMTGEGLPYYADLLDQKAQQHGYSYEAHYAPHDIVVREMGSGKSRQETALSLGINFRVAQKLPLEEGINAVKMTLPRCFIDRTKCQRLLESLRFYHRVYDPKNMVFRSKPQHDWSSHDSDAMRTLAVSVKQSVPPVEAEYSRPNAFAGSWMG